ncbi:hypothetical protein Vafri_8897 [Volvox africanus]|uniref:Eukaryotic translation initiation factor 5B n=1 Tax=Volvox africanus TaxID=51714 RepID=A0A8J4B3A2_9CHLO|nr:hypothetical protein Vafri_8897 [Volvox africanus]
MGKKKATFLDLPDVDDEESSGPAAANADAKAQPTKAKAKKQQKGKKGKNTFDDDEDDDFDPLKKTSSAIADDDEDSVPRAKSKAGVAKGKSAKPAFALLEEDVEEAEEVPRKASSSKKAAKKGGFAALGDEEGDEVDQVKLSNEKASVEAASGLVVAEVLSVQPHPKADRLKVVDVDWGKDMSVVVTNAANVEEGMKVVFAPVGATTPGSGLKMERKQLKGVESFGMLCSAYDIGWISVPDNVLVILPDDAEVGSPCPQQPPKGLKSKLPSTAEEQEAEDESAAAKPPKEAKGGKKGKKGGKDMSSLFAALEEDAEVKEEIEAEVKGEEAPPKPRPAGKDKKGKGGKDMSSLFAALEEDADGGAKEAEEELPAPKPKPEKGKKGTKDMSSLFASLEEDAEASVPAAEAEQVDEAVAPKKDGKKKKGAKDMDSLFAALEEDAGVSGAPTAEVDAEQAAPKKKKDKKKDMSDLFAALEADAEASAAAVPAPAAPEKPLAAAAGKGKAPVKSKEDEEVEALLAELEKPKAVAAGKKNDKKKKGKGGKVEKEEEDIDALLAMIDGPKQQQPAKQTEAAEPAPVAAEPAPPAPEAAEGGEGAEGGDEEGGEEGGKELSAAQKKKLKKKQKEKEKKAAAAEGGAPAAEGAAEAVEEETAGGKGKKGKPVKESAIAKKLREQLEARKKAEEEAARLEAERRAREEEELRRIEEEERIKEEERQRKKEAQRLKREQLKREGKLLTGKAKEEAERRAAMAAQLLAKAAEKGIDLSQPTEAERKKKVVYGVKKKPGRKGAGPEQQGEDGEGSPEPPAEAAVAAEAPAQVEDLSAAAVETAPSAEAATVAMEAAASEAEALVDDWDAVDDWDKIDPDALLAPKKTKEQEEAEARAAAEAKAEAEAKAKAEAEAKAKAEAEAKAKAEPAKAAASAKPVANGRAATKAASPAANAAARPKSEDEESGSEEESEEDSGSESGSEEESEEESNEEESSEEESSEEESSEEESSEEESDEDDSDDESEDSEEARQQRIDEARERRLARAAEARKNANKEQLRSPICCILGHVDVGKTKILDNIRRTNVQDGEAGGITQQIGATFVPAEAVERRTETLRVGRAFDMKLPGLLVIDTPGHESFTNLRQRGSGLCDMAVLIVDLVHGLEQQTVESINLLKMRKTPFVIALNKVDRLYGWKSVPDSPIRDSFKRQKEFVMSEFEQRCSQVFLQLNEQGLNVSLYWKNPDPRKFVNVVPTSAITGEGIPDLLQLIVKLTQTMMTDRLMFVADTQCTVLEVKTMEGLGTTVDVVLVNGVLREGDKIVVCGLGGPIVTRIKALKTPQVLRELRVKGSLMDHKEIRAAMGVKIVAPGLESAVAGTSLFVVGPDDDEEELKDAAMEDMADIFSKVDKGGEGVCVQASTLGSLEALLAFLSSPEVNIPVSGINIGPVHKRDVLRANVMNEKKCPKYAVILAFDVPVSKEARDLSEDFGVRIFTADIIYHLFDQFTAYVKQVKSAEQEAARFKAVFPVVLRILPTCIFNKKDPIVVGVDVVEGIAKIGTPVAAQTEAGLVELGRIAGMEINHKAVEKARAGESVAMKIEGETTEEKSRLFGRHFDHNHQLVSVISRESIDALKQYFADEMTKDDWRLVIKLKKVFQVT